MNSNKSMDINVYKYKVEQSFTFADSLFLKGDTVYLQHKTRGACLFDVDRNLIGKIHKDYYYDIKGNLKKL